MIIEYRASDGIILEADVTRPSTMEYVRQLFGDQPVPLIVADPPYGDIAKSSWDSVDAIIGKGHENRQKVFVDWMLDWVRLWSELLAPGGAFYVWGGVGKPGFRPFYEFLSRVETETDMSLNLTPITWEKVRGYGVQYNYLFCREELAYLCKGDLKQPRRFNVPYRDEKRGYAGYNSDYPAKSEYLRRTTVWRETELLRGKRDECEKAPRVNEIPIEVHTEPGEGVVDLFACTASLSEAARKLGRAWIAVENDSEKCRSIVSRMA